MMTTPATPSPYQLVAHLGLCDGVAVEDARQALQQLCWHTRREPGCLRFELLQQTDDTAGFWLLESFRDADAFAAHHAAAHTVAYQTRGLTRLLQHWPLATLPPQAPVQPDDGATRYARGLARLAQVDGEAGQRVIDALQGVAPALAAYTIAFPFGEVYQDEVLTLKEREIATIAALAALGHTTPQLKVHLHGALNVGCSRDEVIAVLTQMAVYAGFPAAINAVLAAKDVFAERDAA